MAQQALAGAFASDIANGQVPEATVKQVLLPSADTASNANNNSTGVAPKGRPSSGAPAGTELGIHF